MTTKKDEKPLVPDIVEIDLSDDGDVCSKNELTQFYQQSYNCAARKALGLDKLFALHIDASWKTNKLVTALSNNSVHLSSADTLEKISTFIAHDQSIVDLHFSPDNNNCLFTASNDGTIRQWDLRTPEKHSQEFKDEGGFPKPFMSFDINCNGQFLCGGTEQIKKDAYLLLFDTRNTKLMSGYWESHTDDVSHIQFHPTESKTMASCSTDGLINIFDVSQTEEDDALQYSLNSETSCGRLQWLRKVLSSNTISVITHTEAIQFWDVEEATMKHSFDRMKLREALKRNTTETCYAVRCFQPTEEEVLVLAGSSTPNRGCLRILKVNEGSLEPYAILYDKEGANNSQVVRCAIYNSLDGTVITGGEDGIINVWKKGEEEKQTSAINSMVDVPSRKAASSRKSSKKPYGK